MNTTNNTNTIASSRTRAHDGRPRLAPREATLITHALLGRTERRSGAGARSARLPQECPPPTLHPSLSLSPQSLRSPRESRQSFQQNEQKVKPAELGRCLVPAAEEVLLASRCSRTAILSPRA